MDNTTKKFKVPVYIESIASKYIGEVELETNDPEEYQEKATALWESQDFDYPILNVHNHFDMGEWEVQKQDKSDLDFYKNQEEIKNEL